MIIHLVLCQKTIQPETRLSPSSLLVNVKDEPTDDEYAEALISTASTASVKDEPNGTRVKK